MRTTLELDDDLVAAAKQLAREEGVSLGRMISALARQSLQAKAGPKVRNGFPLLTPKAGAPRAGLNLSTSYATCHEDSLLDVNVLVALLDPAHQNHEEAHRWVGRNQKHGWATCPITINGCIRELSNPTYPTVRAAPAEVGGLLDAACVGDTHHFWEDSVSLLDSSLFRLSAIGGHQKITDAYLLGLAVRNHGRLATFDRRVPWNTVIGADSGSLALIDAV